MSRLPDSVRQNLPDDLADAEIAGVETADVDEDEHFAAAARVLSDERNPPDLKTAGAGALNRWPAWDYTENGGGWTTPDPEREGSRTSSGSSSDSALSLTVLPFSSVRPDTSALTLSAAFSRAVPDSLVLETFPELVELGRFSSPASACLLEARRDSISNISSNSLTIWPGVFSRCRLNSMEWGGLDE